MRPAVLPFLSMFALVVNACQPASVGTPPTATTASGSSSARRLPVTWADLGLTGRLFVAQVNSGVWTLDLVTGAISDVYRPPDLSQAWVNAASVAPNGRDVVLAYAPPPQAGEVQFGYTELWLTDLSGELQPRPLIRRADSRESFFTPSWSADGSSIVFAHLTRLEAGVSGTPEVVYTYRVERIGRDGGNPEAVVTDAYWPRLSKSGTRLAYVSFSFLEATDSGLFLAGPDGEDPQRLTAADRFVAVDSAIIAPDDQSLIFSAPSDPPAWRAPHPFSASWWVAAAEAHTVPSDWWRIDLHDLGSAVQLTRVGHTGLVGDFSADGDWLAFMSDRGLFVMRPDGSQLTQLIELGGSGSLEWLP